MRKGYPVPGFRACQPDHDGSIPLGDRTLLEAYCLSGRTARAPKRPLVFSESNARELPATHIRLPAFSKAAVRLAVLDCNGSMPTTHFQPKLERYSHLLTSGLVPIGAMQRAALPMPDRNASL